MRVIFYPQAKLPEISEAILQNFAEHTHTVFKRRKENMIQHDFQVIHFTERFVTSDMYYFDISVFQ